MANVNVTYGEMTDAAGRLTTGKEEVISKLTELQALVNNLVGSGFVTDQASGAFQTSYETFTHGTTEAVNGLEGMASFLNQAATALEGVDSELAKGISG